ncbi:helix-turn-helix domain-containing protein [Noviherbaspirillum pedocola]|uniref:Helix-turn-helix domain-containing protein n=1 Tax=Noviherbaspirillum pedocola TaxID=2801341 RepID=A0A934W1K0_9BURK|nr:helix-turn-helix domain-containing protein [Noviherbaspirillum pedocola]MBK4735266.1 helix-turn-helix domain-containing protein [Noviherbaspirillum pedocola]
MDRTAEHLIADLIRLLHRNASAEEMAQRLVQAEALPDDTPGKSGAIELVRMAMAVRNRLELQQQSEQGMLAVIDSAKDLSSRLDLTGLLHAIVTRARNLLGSQLTWLTVYDADSDEFRVRVSDGAISGSTTQMTAARNLGVAGVVMSTRLPFATSDYLHDTRFVHDPVLDETFRNEGIEALVGVPLVFDDEVIGLLFVADRYHRTHTALNVSILCTLATHAAVAIHNAQAFERANAALKKADLARAERERHVREMQGAAEAHEQLTSLLARGATLGTLCHSIAQLLGGDVLVIDEASQVIGRGMAQDHGGVAAQAYAPHDAHSNAIASATRESRLAGRSVLAWEADGELCRVHAVIGGNDVLGAVLLFRREDLSEVSIRTFERSASIIAIVLLSQERLEAEKVRDVSALLRSLISPRQDEPALALERAERFALDLSQPLCLVLIETEILKPGFVARRLRAQKRFSDLVLDEVDGVVAIVCRATEAQDIVRDFAVASQREFCEGYRGVVSRPVQSPAEIPGLYATLRRALVVLGRIGVRGKILHQNEMALYSVLFETHDGASLNTFIHASIGKLIAHDEKRGSDLTRTMLSYFDSNQNATSTAAQLGIHVNTVRQRLANIEELLGYWGSPNRALEIHVALRLWSLNMRDGTSPAQQE